MDLSIIIPCYRVERYLAECLDSVCSLPQEAVEILCVDDASPDGSGEILREYATKYPHVQVFTHPVNRGLSAARNTGLAHATGDYVLFLDSDDILCTEAVLPMVSKAKASTLDILQAQYMCFEDGTGRKLPAPPTAAKTGVMLGDACFAQQCIQHTYEPITVTRMYRNAFLEENGLRMAEGFLFEDELFTAPAFLVARRAQVSGYMLYRYRQRRDGIMHGFRKSADWCMHYLRISQLLTERVSRLKPTPGRLALRRRATEIALSIPKNIAAYSLEGSVRRQAMSFLLAHKGAIANLARESGVHSLQLQGALLRFSPSLYLWSYSLAISLLRKKPPLAAQRMA